MLQKDITLLHLSLVPGIGPALIDSLRKNSQAFENIYALSKSDLMHLFSISSYASQKIFDGLQNNTMLTDELRHIEKYKIKWITIDDELYPPLLKEIHLPPTVLYFKGNLMPQEKMLALVGSRAATVYGKRVVEMLVPPLINSGWLMVSGGAQGIDTFVHQASIEAHGKTIAILGSGLLRPYPASNKRLFEQIVADGGAVVSSFPLMTDPLAGNFPARNRIISGLSRGTVVVQAARKSGALITARYALEQGREVFAIPGSIYDELSAGCHDLITQGATLVSSIDDIAHALVEAIATMSNKEKLDASEALKRDNGKVSFAQVEIPSQPQSMADLIVSSCTHPCSLDELLAITSLTMAELHAHLFDLQLAQKISQTVSGLWHAL